MAGSDVSQTSHNDHAIYAQEWLDQHGLADKWEVVVADDLHLQCDFDGLNDLLICDAIPASFFEGRRMLSERIHATVQNGLPVLDYHVYESKGGNIHIVVDLPIPLHAMERVAWQTAMGSDPVREMIHLKSIAKEELNPILLFMRKK